jgi:hypothetical protein
MGLNRPGALDRIVLAAPLSPGPAFSEAFDLPSAQRGRGGDANPALWATARLEPGGLAEGVNHIRHATIPAACRASFGGGTSVYPPDDSLICDATSTNPGTLMTGAVIQNYGNHSYMARRPFDFAGRTGTVKFDVDAKCDDPLATYIQISFTADPVPCPTFHIADNDETGPIPRHGLMVALSGSTSAGIYTGVGTVYLYTSYSKAAITPTFELTGTSRPTTVQDKPNHFEILLSSTRLQVWASDHSVDGGRTFPNFRLIWDGAVTMPFTRGYVHFGIRNHAAVKYSHPATYVYHWDNVRFDGPTLDIPRAYEVADNTTSGTSTDTLELDFPYAYRNLGYEVSDGSGRAEGIWSPTANISPLSITGVDLTGMTVAQLTLNLFVNTISHTADVTWGLRYRWNGGTWRTRAFTAGEVTAVNLAGAAGYLGLLIDVTFADLTQGTNTIDFSTVNVPMDYAPIVQNIDLLLAA